MENETISVTQISTEFGRRKQYIFKVLDRLGIERKLERSAAAKGQKVAYISIEDQERLKDYLSVSDSVASKPIVDTVTGGIFYLIQLEPEVDPGRFKLGFATNIEERLRSHKTAAPFSTVIKVWPCKLLWEKTAIDCISQGCERLYTEVFRSGSIEEIRSKGDQFFALMPKLENK